MRDAAAASAFATPGVYWNNPLPARWAVPASDAKYEFLVYVREITDYIEKTFPALRDEVNDLPATLASVTKKMGKDAVRLNSRTAHTVDTRTISYAALPGSSGVEERQRLHSVVGMRPGHD